MGCRVKLDREGCIGCNTCETVAPEIFLVNMSDMKSDIIKENVVKHKDGSHSLELEAGDVAKAKEASESCPVNVIHFSED